jgi:hypothetical protein
VEPPNIVDLIDEPGQVSGDILERFIRDQVNGFDLQRLDEAFRLGVVAPWIRNGTVLGSNDVVRAVLYGLGAAGYRGCQQEHGKISAEYAKF